MEKKKIGLFWKIFALYLGVLALLCAFMLIYVNSILKSFEAAQPERVVEKHIELMKKSAAEGTLEELMPLNNELRELLNSDKYPESFIEFIINNELTYEQNVGSYGANTSCYNVVCGEKKLCEVLLSSENERTEMIVFTRADWSFVSATASYFEKDVVLPNSITIKVNGEALEGTDNGNGTKKYSLSYLGDADVVLYDVFGTSEPQFGKIRRIFSGAPFTVPSNFSVTLNNNSIPSEFVKTEIIREFEFVSEYTPMPMLCTYDLKRIPTKEDSSRIVILDNLGNKVDFTFGDKLKITKLTATKDVPEELLAEADVMNYARNWSLFMTNDLNGGLNSLSKYLIKGTYLYNVAYKWATGIDRTFTSNHTLYNPPFRDERVTNFVKYSEDCFSCEVSLVKKMRISTGQDVDDELSRKIFFLKHDATNDKIDNPVWLVVDMLGIDSEEDGGTDNE